MPPRRTGLGNAAICNGCILCNPPVQGFDILRQPTFRRDEDIAPYADVGTVS